MSSLELVLLLGTFFTKTHKAFATNLQANNLKVLQDQGS